MNGSTPTVSPERGVQDDPVDKQVPNTSYGQILRSSVLIGGSSAVGLVISLFRTKLMAVFLGPSGFGLMGALIAIADLARSVADLGITRSGVRQIAASIATADATRVAITITVLRRACLVLGVLGALAVALLSSPIAMVTFGDTQYRGTVALLSLVVFIRMVSDGQGALLQGMRRIEDIARISVYGAAIGVAFGLLFIFWLREDGIAPALVAIAFASLAVSWWYSRKVTVEAPRLTTSLAREEISALLRLGIAFMSSGILMMGAAYIVRIIVIREGGLEVAGLYQSAWAIGGLYVSFILQAMGTDFYPRLVGAVEDHATCNRLVNEQTQVSMLLAGSGVIGTITFAPLILTLLYSTAFATAAETLQWICLGMAMRTLTWPMGYIVVAKAQRTVFVATEIAWATVNIGLSWILIKRIGVAGAGVAFALSYVFHALMIYPVVRKMIGFRWTGSVLSGAIVQGVLITSAFICARLLSGVVAYALGTMILLASLVYSAWAITHLVDVKRIPRRFRTLLTALRLTPREVIS